MKTGKWLAAAVLALALGGAAGANASERVAVCARYATQPFGYSKGYEVQATYTDGQELNNATSTFGYTVYAKYVVIFWESGQASIIKLDVPYLGVVPTTGKDQEGRTWQVARMGPGSICY